MDRDTLLTREVEQRLQTIRTRAFKYRDCLDLAFACTQGFENGVDSIDQILATSGPLTITSICSI